MASNPAETYGRDIACVEAIGPFCEDATGIDLVRQDAVHLLTNVSFLGEEGEGIGYDVRGLLGFTGDDLDAQRLRIAEVLTSNDPRVVGAVVTIIETESQGTRSVRLEVDCYTDEGPFAIIMSVSAVTLEILEGQTA